MANVDGTFYSGESQRPNTTPVSPPNAGDDPVYPINPNGTGGGGPFFGVGAGLSLDDTKKVQLGNDGAGIIDYSDTSVFTNGVSFLYGDLEKSLSFELKDAEVKSQTLWDDGVNSYGSYTQVQSDSLGSRIDLVKTINGLDQSLIFEPTTNLISIADSINNKGLENFGDYEANFTARSLVTKQYVTSAIGAINVLATPLTGYVVGANTALAATDTILQAFQKTQGQINSLVTIGTNQTVTGIKSFARTLNLSREILSSEDFNVVLSNPLLASVGQSINGALNAPVSGNLQYLSVGPFTFSSTDNSSETYYLRKTYSPSNFTNWRTLWHSGNLSNPLNGSLVNGQVLFSGGLTSVLGSVNFVFDSVNSRLSLGSASSPTRTLDLGASGDLRVVGMTFTTSGANRVINTQSDSGRMVLSGGVLGGSVNNARIEISGTSNSGQINFFGNNVSRMTILPTGEIGIGISPTNTLDVNGTARIRTISNGTGDFLTKSATGVITSRTAAEVRSDIGAVSILGTNPLDWNLITTNGWWTSHTTTLNVPTTITSFGSGQSVMYNTTNGWQYIRNRGGGSPIYHRGVSNGVFGSWIKIWDENGISQIEIDEWNSILDKFTSSYSDLNSVVKTSFFKGVNVGLLNPPTGLSSFVSGISSLYTEDTNLSGWQLATDRNALNGFQYRKVSNGVWSSWVSLQDKISGTLTNGYVATIVSGVPTWTLPNFVTIDTDQTITGAKIFSNALLVQEANTPILRLKTANNTQAVLNFRNSTNEDQAGLQFDAGVGKLSLLTRTLNTDIEIFPHGTGSILLPNIASGTGDVLMLNGSNELVKGSISPSTNYKLLDEDITPTAFTSATFATILTGGILGTNSFDGAVDASYKGRIVLRSLSASSYNFNLRFVIWGQNIDLAIPIGSITIDIAHFVDFELVIQGGVFLLTGISRLVDAPLTYGFKLNSSMTTYTATGTSSLDIQANVSSPGNLYLTSFLLQQYK